MKLLRRKVDSYLADSLVPVEVKSRNGATASLVNLITKDKYPDIKYGIKLAERNIGFENGFFTFPYFLTFLLKRFLREPAPLRTV